MTSKARYTVVIIKIDESTPNAMEKMEGGGGGAEEQEAAHEHSVKNGKEADEGELSTQHS
jgi:hypothetical protein